MSLSIDESGKRFGQLLVIRQVETTVRPNGTQLATFLCKCDCGNEVTKTGSLLRRGETSSCGCQRRSKYEDPKRAQINKKLRTYRYNAEQYGRLWELSDEQATQLLFGKCQYCGEQPSQVLYGPGKGIRRKRGMIYCNGIDRVDNNGGYTLKNCVSCCWTCNSMKRAMSSKDFTRHCHKISAYSENRSVIL